MVKGEAARKTAEGAAYVPMALPSAAEVGALLTQFTTSGQPERKRAGQHRQPAPDVEHRLSRRAGPGRGHLRHRGIFLSQDRQ